MDALAEYNAIFKLLDFTLLENHLTAFNIEKKLIAIASQEKIYLYNSKTKKPFTTLQTHDGLITGIYFITNTPYILTTTANARVMLYNYTTSHYSVRLYSWIKKYKTELPIRISALTIRTNKLLAIGSANGTITLVSLQNYTTIVNISLSYAAISSLSFGEKNNLIAIDAHGEIFVYDLENMKKTKSITTPFTQTKQLLHIKKSPFFLLHSNKNSIALFQSDTCKIVRNNYIQLHHNIAYIRLTHQGNLLVALENREIIHITLQNKKNLASLTLHNMLFEAYNLVEKNPQLLQTKEYKELEKVYKKSYVNALATLQKGNKEKATQLLHQFSSIPQKQEEIKRLFHSYRYYEAFQVLCKQNMYAPAYAMAQKHPDLQYSQEYKTMEATYKKRYTMAQKWVLLANEKRAKELLLPYFNVVSKKESISLILQHNQDFLNFLDAIKHKNHTTIKQLLQKHPNFASLPPYKRFIETFTNTLETINKLLNAADLRKAHKRIQELEPIPSVAKQLLYLKEKYSTIEKLYAAYEGNHFKNCYEILDTHPEMFLELKLANMLEKHWDKLMNRCEKYALNGNVKGIKSTMKELLTLKSRSKRVGALLRSAFFVEIDTHIESKNYKSAENFIYSYIDIFGFDTELHKAMQHYEKKSAHKLAVIQNTKEKPYDAWTHNELLTT